jgi:AraC family transcriptional activator of mtrCDE
MLRVRYNLLLRLIPSVREKTMGALGRLLSIYPVHTALDVRCHFGAPWVLDHEGTKCGITPYHLIVSGSGWLELDGKRDIPLQAGDIILFPQGSAHRLFSNTDQAPVPAVPVSGEQVLTVLANGAGGPITDILCGQFEFGASNALLAALPQLIHVRTVGRDDFSGLQSLMAMLHSETEALRPGARAVVSQLASALFALLMRAWMEQAAAMPGLFALLSERRLQAALLGMLDAPERPWSLAELAEACNMSRATFARLFQKAAGATPATILMQTRMARAASLLKQRRIPVGQVAEMVGYQSEAAFNRIFKRSYGMGPGSYRRSQQGEASSSHAA